MRKKRRVRQKLRLDRILILILGLGILTSVGYYVIMHVFSDDNIEENKKTVIEEYNEKE